MSCRDIESLILAERDGGLSAAELATLTAHLANCPACRAMRDQLAEASVFLKAEATNVAIPDVAGEWHRIRAGLHVAGSRPARKRPLAPVIWFGTPLAAAAVLALAFLISRPAAVPDEDSATIAYVDQESGWLVVWATSAEAKG